MFIWAAHFLSGKTNFCEDTTVFALNRYNTIVPYMLWLSFRWKGYLPFAQIYARLKYNFQLRGFGKNPSYITPKEI